MQTIIAVLMNPTLFESGGRISYCHVVHIHTYIH